MAALNLVSVQNQPLKTETLLNSTGDRERLAKLAQSYQADQQLKYLHLQAEVEVLLQQLRALEQRRQRTEQHVHN